MRWIALCIVLISFQSFGQEPDDISNLLIWLKGDAGVIETAGEVTQWSDQSGNNNHFYPVLSTTAPVLIPSSSLNNEPYIFFNGTKSMQTNSSFSLGNATIFIIAENNTGDAAYGRTIDHAYNLGFWIGRGGGTDAGGGFYEGNAPYGNYTNMTLNTPYAITMVRTGAATTSYKGSSFFATPTRNTFSNPTAFNKIMLGASVLGGDNGNKDIFEVIIYNRALTDQEIETVHTYLRTKYASSVTLGPDVSSPDSFCSATLTPSSGFSSFLWSTGETTSTIDVTESGTYWVRASGPLGFFSYDTVNVNFPSVPLPINTAICSGSFNTWNADMGPGYTYLWSTGETTPSIDISTPGAYNVTVFDGFGCSKNSGDLTFSMDNYPITTSLGSDSVMCAGNTIALQVGSPETTSYLWPDGSAVPSYAVDTTGNYFVETMNGNGCIAHDTMLVTIIGTAPVANFLLENFCFEDVMLTTDLSSAAGSDPLINWTWDFGDGNQSNEQSPSHVYSITGSFTVQLSVEAQSGCTENFSVPIEIHSLPFASFEYSGNCDNGITQFSDLSMQGDGTINGWLWNFGQPSSGMNNTSVLSDPSREYNETGNFDVVLQITDAYGCTDDTTVTVTILEAPNAQFTVAEACQNEALAFSNGSAIGAPNTISSYLWDFGDLTYSILPTPAKSYSDYGMQTITLTATASNGCEDVQQSTVLVHALPQQQYSIGPACVGSYTSFSDLSIIGTQEGYSTTWTLDLTEILYGNIIYFPFTDEGSHNVTYITTSDFGCSSSSSFVFDVGPELSANWSNDPMVIVAGVPVQFTYDGMGAGYWDWNLGNGEHSFFTNPLYTFDEAWADSTLTISLYVANTEGCEDTVEQTFLIERAFYDLAVEQIFLNENNGFMNVGVQLKNQGTSLIDSVDVSLQLKNGTVFQERYAQVLQSGESTILLFNAMPVSFISDQDQEEDWICATGKPYTNLSLTETDLENNRRCLNREGDQAVLIGPYPNPASVSFDFEILVSQEEALSVSLIDARGRLVRSMAKDFTYQPGLYSFHVPLETIQSGVYFLRLTGADTQILRKVLVD